VVKSTVAAILEKEGWPLKSSRRRDAREELLSTMEGCPALIETWRRRPFTEDEGGQVSFVRVILGEFEGPSIRWGLVVNHRGLPIQAACGVRWSMVAAGFHESRYAPEEVEEQLRVFFRELPRFRPRCPGGGDWTPLQRRDWPFLLLDEPPLGKKTWPLNVGGAALSATSFLTMALLLATPGVGESLVIPLGVTGTIGLGMLGRAGLMERSLHKANAGAKATLDALGRSRAFDARPSLAATSPRPLSVATEEPLNELVDLAQLRCAQITTRASAAKLSLRLSLVAVDWPAGIASTAMLLPPAWAIAEVKAPPDIIEVVPSNKLELREPDRIRWLMDTRALQRDKLLKWLHKLEISLKRRGAPYR
jgi:hypothetical protein